MDPYEITRVVRRKLIDGPSFNLEFGMGYISAIMWFDGHTWSKSVTWKIAYLHTCDKELYDLIMESDVFTPYFRE